LAAASLLLALMLVLAACGGGNAGSNESGNKSGGSGSSGGGKQVEISFLYQMDDRWTNEFWNEVVAEFEKQNPGIKVNQMSYPSVEKKQEYSQTLYATDQMPDVTFAGIEALRLVDGVFMELPESFYSQIDDSALIKRNGKVYTVPTAKYIMLNVFYNKEIFAKYNLKPPTTWDEFVQLCETLKANGEVPIVEAGQSQAGQMLHNPMMTAMLNEISEDWPQKFLSGEMKFNGPEVKAIADRFQALWNAGYFHEGSLSFTAAQKDEVFMEGSAAMIIQGIFNSKKYADGSSFEAGWFTLPAVNSNKYYPVMYGEDVGISAKTKHPEEALKLAQFLFSDEIYQQLIERGNAGATTKKQFTYELDYLTQSMYDYAADKTAKTSFMKIEVFPPASFELFRTAAQDIAHGGDVQQTLDKFEQQFRELVEAENK
jgi:raffinose/stachyose/melibiose transport system substrate-binding protein